MGLAWWGSTEKKEASHLLELRGRHQYSDQRSNLNEAPCVATTAVGTKGKEDQMARSSAQREQLTEGREAGKSLMKRGKRTGLRTDPCGTPRRTRKEAAFVILINHTIAPVRKERLSPTSKARKKTSQNQFVEKGGMPDRVKSFREINSRENRARARSGFVKPIRNGLRKVQNLI